MGKKRVKKTAGKARSSKSSSLDPRLLEKIATVTAHRARVVLDHILKYGFITTEELRDRYGYHHPPRARMDVLDLGIPIETFRVRDRNGRSIGAYRFGDAAKIDAGKTGRRAFSKKFKQALSERQLGRCAITGEALPERLLSIDHRVPYQVEGDSISPENNPDAYMLIAVWLQRVKSWACEHCENGVKLRVPATCRTCFWASPEKFEHIAMERRRRVELHWTGEETESYERIRQAADRAGVRIADWIKKTAAVAARRSL